jgi:hypothetical protein
LEFGDRWSARNESDVIRFPDAELSSGVDVGKELKVKLGMRKRVVSEGQSGPGRDRERLDIRREATGLRRRKNEKEKGRRK